MDNIPAKLTIKVFFFITRYLTVFKKILSETEHIAHYTMMMGNEGLNTKIILRDINDETQDTHMLDEAAPVSAEYLLAPHRGVLRVTFNIHWRSHGYYPETKRTLASTSLQTRNETTL